MAAKTPVAREMAPAFEKKAPVTEQPERVIINEAKLRDVFDSPFMHEWVSDGKNNLDHVIENLQFVRVNIRRRRHISMSKAKSISMKLPVKA